jgi:hypothetical protein
LPDCVPDWVDPAPPVLKSVPPGVALHAPPAKVATPSPTIAANAVQRAGLVHALLFPSLYARSAFIFASTFCLYVTLCKYTLAGTTPVLLQGCIKPMRQSLCCMDASALFR